MTTINTIEDLIKLLDENPQWAEALRSRLLTRELIDLPEKFAQFALMTDQRFGRLETDVSVLKEDVSILKEDVAVLKEDVSVLKEDVAVLKEDMSVVKEDVAVLKEDMSVVKRDIQGIRNDLGPLKGAHALNAAREEASEIAEQFGFTLVRALNLSDLGRLVRHSDTTGISANQLRSFRRADLVLEAADQGGDTCFLVIEVSYTANGRDTERVVRHAGLLNRFTGQVARPVVAGLRYDNRVRPEIESGNVLWYELDAEALEPE